MKTRYITLSDGVGMGDVLIVIKTNAPKTLLKELETISCEAYKSGDEVPLWWKEVTEQGYEYEIIDSRSHVTAHGTSEDWLQRHKEWGTILEHYVIE